MTFISSHVIANHLFPLPNIYLNMILQTIYCIISLCFNGKAFIISDKNSHHHISIHSSYICHHIPLVCAEQFKDVVLYLEMFGELSWNIIACCTFGDPHFRSNHNNNDYFIKNNGYSYFFIFSFIVISIMNLISLYISIIVEWNNHYYYLLLKNLITHDEYHYMKLSYYANTHLLIIICFIGYGLYWKILYSLNLKLILFT